MRFLDAKCPGENFGISFVNIGCVIGELQGKRPSDRNRSLCFFLAFLFCFYLFGLKLGEILFSIMRNINQQEFLDRDIPGDIPGPAFFYN